MTDEQKYCELLKEIGEVIKHKNDEISYLRYKCDDLEKALTKAEEQLEKSVARCAVEMMKDCEVLSHDRA